MTIDINKLRRLAQAATPGPWYATGKLTRYVEARIDGGLIQEVAACGPTKADGGYGPQQEANARLIAAANPAAISELLDRLEAAEKERDELRAEAAAMRQQEPVAHFVCHEGRVLWTEIGESLFCFVSDQPERKPLYLSPGARSQPEGWLRAVDDAMVVTHLGVANEDDSYEVAKTKLNNLIGWHIDVATDPAVNGGYRLVPVDPAPDAPPQDDKLF